MRTMKPILFSFILLCLNQSCAQRQEGVAYVNALEFKTKLDSLPDYILLDVRTPEEFEQGHISQAQNLNIYDDHFTEELKKLPQNKPVLVYCKSGSRSSNAASELVRLGYTQIIALDGGLMSWNNANLPVEQGLMNVAEDLFKQEDYKALLDSHPALLIDFYAKWCIPCKKMEPILHELSQEFERKVTIKRINVDEAKVLCRELGIQALPVVAIYKNRQEIKRVEQFQDKAQLEALIKLLE